MIIGPHFLCLETPTTSVAEASLCSRSPVYKGLLKIYLEYSNRTGPDYKRTRIDERSNRKIKERENSPKTS